MMEWQPIETAPKDGQWVLLSGGSTTEDDYMRVGVNTKRPVIAFFDSESDEFSTYWHFCFWDGSWRSGYKNPTHWMPLPSPPAAKEE